MTTFGLATHRNMVNSLNHLMSVQAQVAQRVHAKERDLQCAAITLMLSAPKPDIQQTNVKVSLDLPFCCVDKAASSLQCMAVYFHVQHANLAFCERHTPAVTVREWPLCQHTCHAHKR